jgi:iron only hydrogenase large subunit-like protein/sulfur carrier protein ThiS
MSHKPDPGKNVNLTINGQPVTVPEGTRILEAAKKVNVNIPTLCDHPNLCRRALCRICVVECDGGTKLVAACANDVWEGVNIVTNNEHLLEVRKTILELILANHPPDCLSCIRNKNCKLQSLAAEFGIRSAPFDNTASHILPTIDEETIVRDMSKCIKCGRCVEACQEVQTIGAINTSCRSIKFEICTPYGQTLNETPCVFCGACAVVCPVGAIYEHDQSAQVWAALQSSTANSKQRTIAQVSSTLAHILASVLAGEMAMSENTITKGKMIAAIRRLGFDQVYNADIAAKISDSEINDEVQKRIKNAKAKLPVISGCSKGVSRFVKHFYPDLTDHLFTTASPQNVFAETIKSIYAAAEDLEDSNITSVSFVKCLAQKYGCNNKTDFVLTAKELARLIKLAGIDIASLPEEHFDIIEMPIHDNETETTQKQIIHGFAEARKIMDIIRKGECDAKWIEIESCTGSYCK